MNNYNESLLFEMNFKAIKLFVFPFSVEDENATDTVFRFQCGWHFVIDIFMSRNINFPQF